MKIGELNGNQILTAVVRAVQANKDYLSEVDGLIGDGDHGVNMNKGFILFGERMADRDISLAEGLDMLGTLLFTEIGGSMGPIYGAVFTGMAEAAEEADELDTAAMAQILQAGLDSLWDVVEAQVGDKTLVDTLAPAVASLQASARAASPLAPALREMKAAAEQGRDSTKELVAKFGRSSRLGERSRGVLDAGAVSCCLILCALADGILSQL